MSGETEKALRTFLTERMFCVLSSVTVDGRPGAAFVGYSCGLGFEIMVGTSNKSRKYQNISSNKSVALVMADMSGEVQYEGVVTELSYEEYEALVTAGEFGALPGIDKYRSDPNQVYLKIAPTWIRFIRHGESDLIEEFTEFAQ